MGRFPARQVEVVHRIGARMEARSPGADGAPEERWQRIRRYVALGTLALAALIVIYLLLFGAGGNYTVTASFENAAQLVKGNRVDIAGAPVGSISDISLSDDGQALVKMEISDSAYTPLPEGTHATIRSQSLSGIANRYVDLALPTHPDGDGNSGGSISSGGQITQADTTSEVDLDQLFNTLDKPTVSHLQEVIRGFARAYQGVGAKANRGFYYLNPFLSTSRRVFGELNSDQANLEGLVVDAAGLTSTLDARSPQISSLVANLDGMLGTIGSEQSSLASAVGQLPDFMRQFNTTAVNLRAALDDVQPLIDYTRPVARKLQPFAKRLRGFARDAVPTVKGLNGVIKKKGPANDLIELTRLQDPLAEIGVGPVERNGASRPGALPASADSLKDSLTQLSTLRAYSPELTGWFDDFGHSGFPDAFGGIGRISTTLNTFSVGAPSAGVPCNDIVQILLIPGGTSICQTLNPAQLTQHLGIKDLQRCPGSNERGLTDDQLTQGGTVDCDPSQTPLGP
jgi:phospholipid/cholesterol/gamma-HCH transport system substrate-binding protein